MGGYIRVQLSIYLHHGWSVLSSTEYAALNSSQKDFQQKDSSWFYRPFVASMLQCSIEPSNHDITYWEIFICGMCPNISLFKKVKTWLKN
ncbi:hypothetical protein Lal_00046925 [Lupinus albus]|nr:hypothetical protein Lal_00046925 [Lupinus albus]